MHEGVGNPDVDVLPGVPGLQGQARVKTQEGVHAGGGRRGGSVCREAERGVGRRGHCV